MSDGCPVQLTQFASQQCASVQDSAGDAAQAGSGSWQERWGGSWPHHLVLTLPVALRTDQVAQPRSSRDAGLQTQSILMQRSRVATTQTAHSCQAPGGAAATPPGGAQALLLTAAQRSHAVTICDRHAIVIKFSIWSCKPKAPNLLPCSSKAPTVKKEAERVVSALAGGSFCLRRWDLQSPSRRDGTQHNLA